MEQIKLNGKNAQKVLELKAHIDKAFNQAVDDRDEKVARYQRSYLYYLCKAPEQAPGEHSNYIDPVVRKAVEAVKPSIMNVFTENEKKAVSFRPTSLVPAGVAALIDDEINNVFLRKNEGYAIIERAITEALITGDTFLKFFTEESIIEEPDFPITNVSAEEIGLILSEFPDTDYDEINSLEEKEGLFSGTLNLKRIENNVRIENVDFKDLFIDTSSEDIADSNYVCHRIKKSVGELVEMGFDFDKVSKAMSANNDYDYLSTEELVNTGTFMSSVTDEDVNCDELVREVYLYEHYIYSSLFSKKVKLYRVLATNVEILAIEEAPLLPFVHGKVENIPGSFWGVGFYDKFYREQDIASRARRIIEDHAKLSAYGRYQAVKGGYDRQSLINNRPGGVIEVQQIGAVVPFDIAPMSPTVMEMLNGVLNNATSSTLSAAGVDVTGANVSATAAAITANSADMKDKVLSRVLAYTLFRPLFKGLYYTLRNMNPAFNALPHNCDFQVDVNTTNDEGVLGAKLIQLGSMYSQWSQVPTQIIQQTNMVEMAKTITGLSEEDVTKYFNAPQEPDPEVVAIEEQKKAEMEEMNKRLLELQIENAEATLLKVIAETAKVEQEAQELVLNGEHKRKMEEDESLRKFKALGLQAVEQAHEIQQGVDRVQISKYIQ